MERSSKKGGGFLLGKTFWFFDENFFFGKVVKEGVWSIKETKDQEKWIHFFFCVLDVFAEKEGGSKGSSSKKAPFKNEEFFFLFSLYFLRGEKHKGQKTNNKNQEEGNTRF